MENLSDDLLIETYVQAEELNLDKDFRRLIAKEIQKRGITKKLEEVKMMQK